MIPTSLTIRLASSPGRSLCAALLLSLFLHGLLGLGSLAVALPALLRGAPITVEILPPRKPSPPQEAAPAPAPAPPQRPAAGPGPRPRRAPDNQERKPPAGKPAAPADLLASLESLSVDGSSLMIVLRMAPLRGSPHRAAAEALLAAFPDARTLSQGTPLTPQALARRLVDDLDALVISTPDPRDITATALLAIHPEQVHLAALLAARTAAPWDPRLLRVAGPGLSALARPEILAFWREHAANLAALRGQLEVPDPAQPGEAGPVPAVTAALQGFVVDLRPMGGSGTVAIERAVLDLGAQEQPQAALRLITGRQEDAALLARMWPPLRAQITERFGFLVGALLDDLRASRRGAEVTIAGPLPTADLARVLNYAALGLSLVGPQAPAPPQPAPALQARPPAAGPDAAAEAPGSRSDLAAPAPDAAGAPDR